MSGTNPAREVSLPRWAQAELQRLRESVAQLEADLAELRTAPESEVALAPMPGERPHYLPARATIRFYLGRSGPDEWIEARVRDGALELMGWRWISLYPSASNVVRVKVQP